VARSAQAGAARQTSLQHTHATPCLTLPQHQDPLLLLLLLLLQSLPLPRPLLLLDRQQVVCAASPSFVAGLHRCPLAAVCWRV
jgi:hypothetical protein